MSLPPHSIESEAALIGCILVNSDCLDSIAQAGFQEDWFYEPKHRTVIEAARSLLDAGKPVDPVTVANWLKNAGRSQELSISELSQMPDKTPSAANWPYYLETVRSLHVRRSLIRACLDIASQARETDSAPDALISSAESAIDRCRVGTVNTESSDNRSVMKRFMNAIQERHEISKTRNGIAGIPTGFPSIDQQTSGLIAGELCIIAARPGVGKTALGLNIATHAAIKERVPTLFLTAEMSDVQLMGRVVSSWAKISGKLIRSGLVASESHARERSKMIEFAKQHAGARVFWEDIRKRKDIDVVGSIVRSYVRKHQVQLVMVDYLQLLTAKRGDNRAYEVGEVVEGLKNIAVQCNVAMVAMAQLNRDGDKGDKPRSPKLSDLKDSGSIEQAGECIMFINRDKDKAPTKATLTIAKMRDGGQFVQPLYYDAEHFTFVEESKIEEAM